MQVGIYFNHIENGPGKVVNNLLKGFDLSSDSYKINSDGDINLILQGCRRLGGDLSNCFLGPNICTLPIDNEVLLRYHSYRSLIVPSAWVKDLYKRWVPENKLKIWAVGIDTQKFSDKSACKKKYDFLIYYKRRDRNDLHIIIDKLNNVKKTYILIEYGKYTEDFFIKSIESSRYGIVIDNCESQGIAIQEMMSCNLPILVWNVKSWNDRGSEYSCDSTSIPYWNESCGEIFYQEQDFLEKIDIILNNNYSPRNFIVKTLSLESSVHELKNILYSNS